MYTIYETVSSAVKIMKYMYTLAQEVHSFSMK